MSTYLQWITILREKTICFQSTLSYPMISGCSVNHQGPYISYETLQVLEQDSLGDWYQWTNYYFLNATWDNNDKVSKYYQISDYYTSNLSKQ